MSSPLGPDLISQINQPPMQRDVTRIICIGVLRVVDTAREFGEIRLDVLKPTV